MKEGHLVPSTNPQQTVFITGGTGFVGKSLVQRLAQNNSRCFLTTRTPVKSASPWVNYLACDLTNPDSVASLKGYLSTASVLIHIAGLIPSPSIPKDAASPYIAANVTATVFLLQSIHNILRESDRLKSIIFISTLDVYGSNLYAPAHEESPTKPKTAYAVSKLCAEALMTAFGRLHHIGVSILRLSHVYGPGEPVIKAIPQFIRKVIKGERPVIHGDGSDERDYVYVGDVAQAIEAAADCGVDGIYNISGGKGCSIKEVAETIIRISGKQITPVFEARRHPFSKVIIDNSKALKTFAWKPSTELTEGLANQYRHALQEQR